MTDSLFVYGSLQIEEVMETVVGRLPPSEPASLVGFARRALVDRSYPGLAPRPGETTAGVVFGGLTATELEWLDLFEGDLYERIRVDAQTAAGERKRVYVYVIVPEERALLDERPWDLEAFRSSNLEPFLEMCRAFRSEILAPDAGR